MMIAAIIQLTAVAAGFMLTIPVVALRRFGPRSWLLATFLLPSAVAVLNHGLSVYGSVLSREKTLGLSFSLLIFAAIGGFFFLNSFQPDHNLKAPRQRRIFNLALGSLAGILIALLQIKGQVEIEGLPKPEGSSAFGIIGYLSALFLLIISIIVLAILERFLRAMEESVRWEIKFLLLGIGAAYAAMIYVSSKILLYSPRIALVTDDSLSLYSTVFLVSCGLIAISWKRSSGRTMPIVSHKLIYSSITFLSVGLYLIASSLIARKASRLAYLGIPSEAFFFLLSIIILTILLLWTSFRHRIRNWIRRHLLAGSYDYRPFWLEATERVQSTNDPQFTAAALADIVHRALGAIDISVWIRLWHPNRLQLLSTIGSIPAEPGSEVSDVTEEILNISAPISRADLEKRMELKSTKRFMESTCASLLVPLISGNRIVGVITVGSDPGGRTYGWEAYEFLLVLGGHAAGEFHKSDLLATVVAAKEDEAFRTFSTFVLHDLKNFASTLSLIAQNAVKFQNNPDFQRDSFHSIYETAEKMKRLCGSLRSFSTTLAANKKSEDLNQIVRAVADKQTIVPSGQLHLELGNLPLIMLDKEEIARVLQNLVLNAQQAISSDGSIWIRTAARDGIVELKVADNGIGMSEQFLRNELFLPFHTTKSDGLGIGMFQTKKIVKAHNGEIRVESKEGKGTTVTVEFIESMDRSKTEKMKDRISK